MKNKFYQLISAIIIYAVSITPALADKELQGAYALFENISSAVSDAVTEAEQLFYQNQGQVLAAPYDKITYNNGVSNHPVLDQLKILTDYSVYIKIAASGQTVTVSGQSVELPVARALGTSEFLLMPNKLPGDTHISGWYCLTNADSKISMFMGDTKTKVNSASLVTQYTKNPFLEGCIYSGDLQLYNP